MKASRVRFWTARLIMAVSVLPIIYGVIQLIDCRALATNQRAAADESLVIPIFLDNIRAIREGDTPFFDPAQDPALTSQIWHEKVDKVVKSQAFAAAVASNRKAKAVNPKFGFDEALFVKTLSQMAGERNAESVLRRGMAAISMEAASRQVMASFALNNQILFGGFWIIVGWLGLLLRSAFLKHGTKTEKQEAQISELEFNMGKEPFIITKQLGELNTQESSALEATSEALVRIRVLASKPVTENERQVIWSLADAFHNIPAHAAGPAAQRVANAFLVDAGIKQARLVNKRHGLTSQHLAPL